MSYRCDKVEEWLDCQPIGEQQANDIANAVVSNLTNFNGVRPNVVFLPHHTTRRRGYCYTSGRLCGKIGLPINGQNWGVLAHEISHLAEGSRGHDTIWYNTCIEVRKLLATMWKQSGGVVY